MRKPLTAFLLVFLLVGALALSACGQDETDTTKTQEIAETLETVTTLEIIESVTAGDTVSTVTSSPPGGQETATTGKQLTSVWQRFTSVELAQFDGKDGRPAYVAVDGVVYDVSDSSKWPEGEHTSCNLGAMAGKDLSDVLAQAPPRMRTLMEKMPVVGSLD